AGGRQRQAAGGHRRRPRQPHHPRDQRKAGRQGLRRARRGAARVAVDRRARAPPARLQPGRRALRAIDRAHQPRPLDEALLRHRGRPRPLDRRDRRRRGAPAARLRRRPGARRRAGGGAGLRLHPAAPRARARRARRPDRRAPRQREGRRLLDLRRAVERAPREPDLHRGRDRSLAMEERIAELESELTAKDKTIKVLMDRVQERQENRGTAFALLEHNAALEKIVGQKTRELEIAVGELRETQAKLLGAQKLEAIGQLAAGIAHEINTPAQYVADNVTFLMRALRGMTEALAAYRALAQATRAGEPTAAPLDAAEAICRRVKLDYLLRQVPRALEQSLEGLARVTSIVGAMKDFSHPSQGLKTLSDVHEMVQTTLTVARNEWKYVADVVTELDPSLRPVPCLRDELNQVLLNLIVNASHAISDA